jgi:hypothetical protein
MGAAVALILGLMANTFWAAPCTLPLTFWVIAVLTLVFIFGLMVFTFWATARASRGQRKR